MTELQQNRYDRLLRRVGGLIGAKSMVNDVLGELFPMIDVENLNAELALLSGTRLGFSSSTQGAIVGSFNHSQLFNPANSNVLIVLERVDFQSNSTQIVFFQITPIALTNQTTNSVLRDTREGLTARMVGQVREVQQVAPLTRTGAIGVVADETFTLDDKRGLFVLGPGRGLTFATSTNNTSLVVNYLWRERVAEVSELNFP